MWLNQSLLADADVTWGLAALVARTLRVSPLEMEDPTALLLDPDRALRYD